MAQDIWPRAVTKRATPAAGTTNVTFAVADSPTPSPVHMRLHQIGISYIAGMVADRLLLSLSQGGVAKAGDFMQQYDFKPITYDPPITLLVSGGTLTITVAGGGAGTVGVWATVSFD